MTTLASIPDQSKKRKTSSNEHVHNALQDSDKKQAPCQMCLLPKHRAGPKCPVVASHKAQFAKHAESRERACKVADPVHCLVEGPNELERIS